MLFAAFAALSAAVVHPEVSYTNGWQKTTRAHAFQPVTMTFAVKEQNIDEVKRIANEVSDPDSPKYGQYLTQEKLDALVAPKESDMTAVKSWLSKNGLTYEQKGVSNLVVSTNVVSASALLNTEFHSVHNFNTDQELIRAGDYEVPDSIQDSVAAVFGLHGLPLPPKQVSVSAAPALVTPDVLASTYSIAGVKVSRSAKNRQAVAEFQGQFMNSTDLKGYFSKYVKNYEAGTDDVVTKFVGEHKENSGGIEAELDIQYIMGVNAGIQTEFWEFPAMDFCNDLNQWTSNLTSEADIPIVHSVSYGWQGNLSKIGCHMPDVTVVDNNFAKLAAKGVSIMISSGDSGSGYTSENTACEGSAGQGEKGVGIDGTVSRQFEAREAIQCCDDSTGKAGWTFVPAAGSVSASATNFTSFTFKNAEYHTIHEGTPSAGSLWKTRDVDILNGEVAATGGSVTFHNANGTFADTTFKFGAPKLASPSSPEWFSLITGKIGNVEVTGRAVFFVFNGQQAECINVEIFKTGSSSSIDAILERGGNPPPPPPPGMCTIYSSVTKKTTANSTTFSGFPAAPKAVQLYPSWPASSPWVTAVGATRFVGQKVGSAEMASDQFGSGGGFSSQFSQSPDATYQSAAVAKYLSTVDKSTLPPADAFPAMGRATPDVSALGEGYQVLVGGRVQSIGGTSASSPAFAGMVALLNEARLNAGKPAMGFLNTFLYKNEDAFTTVTLGSNKVGRGGQALPYGFNCSAGWDPATGLGTPKFDKLLAAAMA
jgi:subtilase family serine protease